MTPTAGFYGKVPSRGDFVGAGLPGSFVAPWDAWLQAVLGVARLLLGEGWTAAWLVAPVWRYALPPGQCGPAGVLGVWMPSVDAVGRDFPLTVAAVLPGAAPSGPAAECWLDAAEDVGREAIATELSPSSLRQLVPPVPTSAHVSDNSEAGVAIWWSSGSPYVPAARLCLSSLPDAARFAAMVRAPQGVP